MDKDHEYFVDDWNKDSDTDNYQQATYNLSNNWNWFANDPEWDANSSEGIVKGWDEETESVKDITVNISNKWWNNWLTDDFKSTFNLRRQEIWDAQVEKAQAEFGALLATCQAGIDCQNEVKAKFIQGLRKDWHEVLK